MSKKNKNKFDDVVDATKEVDEALTVLKANGEDAYVIGKIIRNDEKVVLC